MFAMDSSPSASASAAQPLPATSGSVSLWRIVATVLTERRPWPVDSAALLVSNVSDALEEANASEGPSPHAMVARAEIAIEPSGTAFVAQQRPQSWAQLLAPESLRGQPSDERTEVFGLGVLLAVLTTARWPFVLDGSDPHAPLVLHDLLYQGPSSGGAATEATDATDATDRASLSRPSMAKPDYPDSLERALLTALTKDPWVRYQRLADFRRDVSVSVGPDTSVSEWVTRDGGDAMGFVREVADRPWASEVLQGSTMGNGAGTTRGVASDMSPASSPRDPAVPRKSSPNGVNSSARQLGARRGNSVPAKNGPKPWVNAVLWALVGAALIGLAVGIYAAVNAPADIESASTTPPTSPVNSEPSPVAGESGASYEDGEDLLDSPPEAIRPRPAPSSNNGETGRVSLKSNLRGASVFVDGDPVGRTPLQAVVMYTGEHTFTVRAGPAEWTQRRTVVKGQLLSLTALLHASRVHLQNLGGADCTIDTVTVSTSGRRPLFVGVGKHRVRCLDPEATDEALAVVVDKEFEATAGSVHRFLPTRPSQTP